MIFRLTDELFEIVGYANRLLLDESGDIADEGNPVDDLEDTQNTRHKVDTSLLRKRTENHIYQHPPNLDSQMFLFTDAECIP